MEEIKMQFKYFVVLWIAICRLYTCYACSMENVTNWLLPVTISIYDIDEGVFFRRSTSNIEGIISVTNSEGLNAGPYISVSYETSEFAIATNDQYPNYEELETTESMGVTVDFRCTDGSTNTLVFYINIIDTNNNKPQFKPESYYNFKVIPPLPPGFLLTDCINDIIVRDIDLTTQRIDFEIEENPYFEIINQTSLVPKEFKAVVRSIAFIRRIPEPIVLIINATDVDLTGNPSHTSSATILIEADSDYELPDELIFSETFYLATYTNDNQVILEKDIHLQQGYDEQVTFSLEGAYVQIFDLQVQDNRITLKAKSDLPNDLLNTQIILILKATREHTIGATSTIIISLPKGPKLKFEKAYYEGSIVDNDLVISNLTLLEVSEHDNFSVTIFGDFAQFFTAIVERNIMSLQLNDLDDNIIRENNILTLQVVAATNNISAECIVVLEIIKDDFFTPIFEKSFYNGTYDAELGVIVEDIVLIQGYDETVTVFLTGEYKSFFEITQDGAVFKISSPGLPSHILNKHAILLTLSVSKPRTVGANAVIYIAMPEARILAFKSLTYSGVLVNNSVILDTIELSVGYTEQVYFTLTGDYANYFELINNRSSITLNVLNLPESVISDNNILIFNISATDDIATASTTVILEILKQDVLTPVFSRLIYNATYVNASAIDIENIYLVQGFDENITFRLSGEHAQYFGISNADNRVTIFLETEIPEELIYEEKVLLFNILAEKTLTVGANAAVSVSFPRELTEPAIIRFSKNTYTGQINNNSLIVETITLIEGYSDQTEFTLTGDYASLFSIIDYENNIKIELVEELPTAVLENNNFIILNIESFHPNRIKGQAAIVLEIIRVIQPALIPPVFDRPYYIGEYSTADKLQFNHTIQLKDEDYDNVNFILEGESVIWFTLVPAENGALLELTSPLPAEVLDNNQQLIFIVTAEILNVTFKPQTTIIIVLNNDNRETQTLRFENTSYVGVIENNILDLKPISIVEGYSSDVIFSLSGELASYFTIIENEGTVSILLKNNIADDLSSYRIIVLELKALAPKASTAYTTIVIEVIQKQDNSSNTDLLIFEETYYIGHYNATENLIFSDVITLREGYDEKVEFSLIGENSIWFEMESVIGGVTLLLKNPIPVSVLENNRQLIFEITAHKSTSAFTAKSAIIITHTFDFNDTVILGFEKSYYIGSVDSRNIYLEDIILTEGYSENVQFTLQGELASLFTIQNNASEVILSIQDIQEILSNQVIVLQLEATAPEAVSSFTIVILEVIQVNSTRILKFEEAYYTGVFTEQRGLNFNQTITLAEGYDDNVEFVLDGDDSVWFSLTLVENGALLILSKPIPEVIQSQNLHLIFTVMARKPGAVDAWSAIIISLPDETEDSDVFFSKLVYKGVLKCSDVTHESISVYGYDGNNIEIFGDQANSFIAEINGESVTVQVRNSTSIPTDTTYVILELRVSNASSVLILDIIDAEKPVLPTIRFSSESYIIRVDISQTGLIGLTAASADNGESVTYSLLIQNVELRERLTINHDGELHLAAPASSGIHTFEVIATTVFTRVNGSAMVILIVEEAATCSNEIAVPPLIVIEREEESPHDDLVILNTTSFNNCRYEMSNRWPVDQNWLYVDQYGLHTRSIDREHDSIAFMPVSQIQVELILKCDSDSAIRNKRSLDWESRSLGPYDYGSNKWILTDTILYNARRSFVNLIVQDINDNDPVFILKDNEPIAVGYPLPELEEIVLPRALVELKATDADIGENAALVYWSTDSAIAVSASTGSVHVRSNVQLQDNVRLRVHATDRNGLGRTGYIDLVVRLLNLNHIAVITINNSFLEDETGIIANLTTALRYEIKALRSVVTPADLESNGSRNRKKRDSEPDSGPLLQLFIYGMDNGEPVQVSKLVTDIGNNIVMSNIAKRLSLEDYLESREICTIFVRNTALLAATIALSILLFIIMLVFGVWYFLKWKTKFDYDKFSDQKSLSSKDQFQLPSNSDEYVKPRLNLEVKKDEKGLQDILDTTEQPGQSKQYPESSPSSEVPIETMVDIIPSPLPEQRMPIVIQSIDKLKDAIEESDDEDEFGETVKSKRKSVVTFNENVEKIIHLEDNSNDPDFEIYKF